jgi:hypothetical protein
MILVVIIIYKKSEIPLSPCDALGIKDLVNLLLTLRVQSIFSFYTSQDLLYKREILIVVRHKFNSNVTQGCYSNLELKPRKRVKRKTLKSFFKFKSTIVINFLKF